MTSGTDRDAATTLGLVAFIEYGPHKTIQVLNGPASGTLRVSDQKLIVRMSIVTVTTGAGAARRLAQQSLLAEGVA